ncbi:MAG: hypothetical protein H6810_01255 [Phycisphaeraceae bacterium]|nr:MAG: hypothetical protein H6810_01255 [Phycisphaeraceae bacterium]
MVLLYALLGVILLRFLLSFACDVVILVLRKWRLARAAADPRRDSVAIEIGYPVDVGGDAHDEILADVRVIRTRIASALAAARAGRVVGVEHERGRSRIRCEGDTIRELINAVGPVLEANPTPYAVAVVTQAAASDEPEVFLVP